MVGGEDLRPPMPSSCAENATYLFLKETACSSGTLYLSTAHRYTTKAGFEAQKVAVELRSTSTSVYS
jgi:hypothetical protein